MAVDTTQEAAKGAMDIALAGLHKMIVHGTLLPGEQIRQQEIAEQLGVSRVPLREALNVLARQGRLLHRPHQGYFVTKRLPIELAQIRRMLDLLEGELLQSLEWPDAATLAELEALHREMTRHAQANDWTPLLSLNRRFHFRIFQLSPYSLILDQVDRLWAMADPYIAIKLSSKAARLQTVKEHAQLLDALKRKDRQACISVLDTHRYDFMTELPNIGPADGGVRQPAS